MRAQIITSWLISVIAIAPSGAQTPETAGRPSRASIAARVDSVVANFLAGEGPSAMSIAVVRGNDTLVFGAWGLADRERKVAATTATGFHIASVTKQFTAALVMRLVERGRITLADTIGQHLAQLPRPWRGVTILQLLNHTAGIPDDGEDEFRWAEAFSPDTLITIKAMTDSLRFAPGSRWQYSNTGYVVLGMLIEKLYARSLADVIQQELAVPLGLARTRYCPVASGADGQAVGYSRNGSAFVPTPSFHVSHEFSAGGICSTIGDLLTWNRALHGGKVVSAASYSLMTTPQGGASTERYGFGLRRNPILGRDAIEHTGGIFGFVSLNTWFPAETLSVTVLTNTYPIPSGRALLLPDLVRLALGLPVRIATPAIAVDPAALLKYTGRYTVTLPNRQLGMLVFVEGDHLVAQPEGQGPLPLRATAEHTFGTLANPTVRFTFVVDGGAVKTFVFEQSGMKFDAARRP